MLITTMENEQVTFGEILLDSKRQQDKKNQYLEQKRMILRI